MSEPVSTSFPPPSSNPFRVALVQAPPVFLNLAATVGRAEEKIRDAAARGATVVVFPETWLPGYPVWIDAAPGAALWDAPGAKALHRILRANAPAIDGPECERIASAAAAAEVHVVMGLHERVGGTLYNTMLFVSPSGRRAIHRKLVPTYTERLVWGPGDGSTLRALSTGFGALGGLVCWEHWMPHARAVMHAQREVLHVAQWPWVHEMHRICSRQYAFEGRCWVAASGCVLRRGEVFEGFDSLGVDEPEARALLAALPGDDDAPLMRGASCLIAPDGTVECMAEEGDPTTLLGEVDPRRIDEELMTLDTAGHYSRPDIFSLAVDTTARIGVDPLEDGADD